MPAGPILSGAAIAIKKGRRRQPISPKTLGEGLQAFCIPGSVADDSKVGIGHGNLAAMLLAGRNQMLCFLAGHESFAAAEGAIGMAKSANKARKEPLRVILNGLGKTRLRSSPASTGSPMCRHNLTIIPGNFHCAGK